jgi:hypothetical protein
MVKKLLLALFLLVLLVGLSYVKIVRKSDQINNAFTKGKIESEDQLSRVELDNDSLKDMIIRKEKNFKDSLSNQEIAFNTITDSLCSYIDSMGITLEDLQNKLKSKESQLAQVKSSNKSTNTQKTISLHEQILTAYKNKYRSLPSDLSDYEKKVAISEIRDETARQYKITVAELNKLRSDNNIDF